MTHAQAIVFDATRALSVPAFETKAFPTGEPALIAPPCLPTMMGWRA